MEEITKEMVSEQPRLRLQWLIQEVSKIVELPIKKAQPRRPITRATRQRAVPAPLDESSKSDSSDESDGDEIMHRMASQRETPTAPKALKNIFVKKRYPYYGSYDLDYEKARSRMLLPTKQALLAAGMKPMKNFWLNDEAMEALLHKELDHMSEQNREDCYIFSTHVWTNMLRLRRNPQTGHMLHPANRYDNLKSLIWPRREKKRIEAQRKFNPLKRKYLFLPIFQDNHWSLIVVVNPWKTLERLVDPDPTTEVFNMPVNPDGKIETPCDVSEEFAEKYNLTENERHDSNQYSQFAPYESEPVIYHFCSLTKTDWIQKCELACELLTGMFLDESNPDLKPIHDDLLGRGLLNRTPTGLQIEHGRKPRRLVCDRATRRNMNRPWPCDECLNNGPNRFQKFLPFRYYHQSSPQQCNEYDCGVYTIYAIRKWFQNEKHIKRYLHTDLENWWTPIDIYNYKYACRRYFDMLANVPDREPVNVFGTPEENGYLKSVKASYAAYRVFKGMDQPPEETETKTEPASEVIEEEVISQDDDDEEEELIEEPVQREEIQTENGETDAQSETVDNGESETGNSDTIENGEAEDYAEPDVDEEAEVDDESNNLISEAEDNEEIVDEQFVNETNDILQDVAESSNINAVEADTEASVTVDEADTTVNGQEDTIDDGDDIDPVYDNVEIDLTGDTELPKPIPTKKRKRRARAAASQDEEESFNYAMEVHRTLNRRISSRRAASTPKTYTPTPVNRRADNSNKVTKRTPKSMKRPFSKSAASAKKGSSVARNADSPVPRKVSPTKSEPLSKKKKRSSQRGSSRSPARSGTPNGGSVDSVNVTSSSCAGYAQYLLWLGACRGRPGRRESTEPAATFTSASRKRGKK
ncbi:unnamed protein product [Oikopleura dioica]|uniref:Ubiquitin-like protease family profile domain-containing protein n=1 Tax=Oikopleura dioica TaxID=34765 RepID=E4Y1W3_OIKDI|nr:unnamed protein product [Oikopleura dioica]